MYKTLRHLHLWLSVPFGLLILVISFTGAILCFEKELTLMGQSRQEELVQTSSSPQAATALTDSPRQAPSALSDSSRQASPALGKPSRQLRPAFFKTVEGIHRRLMWGRTGKTIVGISVIAFVLILITGVWMWSYSARRNLRRSLSLTKPDVVRGLHVGLGVYATLFLLVMALTGIAWSFPVLFRTFAKWSGDGFTFFHIWHDLHTGAWGGVAARAVWFLAALVGASLPVTGYWLWARRLVLQRRSRQRL